MSEINRQKVFVAVALIALTVLGVSVLRGWPSLAIAAGQAQPPEHDTLFFVGGSQTGIQRMTADEPRQMAEQTASAVVDEIDIAMCDVFGLHASPNGRWIAVDVGCEVGSRTLLLETATGQMRPAEPDAWQESFFLNWTPDGDSFLLRVDPIGDDLILLVDVPSGRFERMDTPPFTYDVTFSPDSERVLYATTQGLGFGSEVWTMDRDGHNREQIINDPAHVIAYPRWSPTGDTLAYIRMADSNVPFTVGELVLADGDGHNERLIAHADAGHGYAPVWSPNGRQVAFVVRENPGNSAADMVAPYLESNIHLVDVATGGVRELTQFENTLTDDPTWSPDGAWLAFSTNAGGPADVWLVEIASGDAQQVTQNANARYPVWLMGR